MPPLSSRIAWRIRSAYDAANRLPNRRLDAGHAVVLHAADVAADPREMIPRPSDGRRSHCTLYPHYTCGVDFVNRERRKFVKIF